MADGNLGSLWMSLGIKESVSKELKRIADSMTGVDSTTKKTRESLLKLANTSMEGKDARWLDKMRKSLGETSVEAKELQAVLSSIKFDGKGKGWKKLTEDIDINNLNKYASLVNEIEKTLSRMEGKTGLSSAGNDLMLTVHNVRFALSQLSEIKQELSQAGGLSLSAKGLENYRASLNSLFNEGASLLSSPVANLTKLDDWVNKFDKRITDIYDSVLNQSKSVSQSATAATDSLKKEEEQAKKTAEAVASIGERRKPAAMKESQQEAAFNKDVSKIAESNTTMREGANELAGVKQEADSAKKSIEAVKYELNEMLNAFRGAASKKLGIAEAGDKGRQYVDILNQINKKVEEWKRKEGGEANAAMIDQMAKNALSYLRLLQRIDNAERSIQEKRSANPNVDASRFKEASNVIAHFKEQLKSLEDSKFLTGVDSANVLGRYAQTWTMTLGQVDEIIGKFQKRNPLSDLDSNFSKIDAKIDGFREKLAKLRDLMSEGTSKGFKTSMLTDRITGMSGIIAQMEKAMANDGKVLSNADRMKQLFSDMQVEMSKTTAAFQAYGREKGKIIAQEREHNKELSKIEQQESRLRSISETLSKVDRKIREFGETRDRSVKLGADTTSIDSAIAKLSDFRNRLNTADFGNKQEVLGLISEYRILSNEIGNTKSNQDKLNRSIEALNKRNSDKATRDSVSLEKQRQSELEISRRRIQSVEKALANLQEKRFASKMLGLDTSEAEAKIFNLKIQLSQLWELENKLFAKDMTAVGKLGNIGNGREVQAANDLARSYDRANKEAQKGVEIEQKRQAEIAKSAAKVQADLVRGFERANSHAGKLNSTIQDLKSLFLQGGLVFGAQQFAMSIITTGGEMEKQHIALQSILGDMQNANTLFGQIKELALNSPFTFSELNRDVKQLAAYGVEYDQLYDTTKRLADMSSGLGVSFDRIALAFGQVQARGWLDGKELRQIAYAGIPLLNKLSEFYSKQEGRNVSTSEIKTRISNREVSFDDVKSIFWQMTDAGGQFYNMQQTLSETLLGRYNKLKDAWEIMLADFADGKGVVGGTFKFIIEQMTSLVQLMHTFSPMVVGMFSGFALKKAGTLLAGSAASNFLTNKEKIAQDIKARALAGQQLSQTEVRILATKKQITKEDLQNLITAKAVTKTELQRLYLSGKISGEMYKQSVTSAGMNNFWTNFANKGGVAISLLGKGLGSMFSSLWAMIGGLPGLILTAVTVGVGYAVSKYQELSRAIEQTQEELTDRLKQINDFKNENASLLSKAISSGDEREIDNLIDTYKEKLKELAPYNFENLSMKADEKQSHIERLKYLDQELEKLREADKLSKSKLNSRGNYSDLKDAIDYANQFYDNKEKLTYKYISDGVNKETARKQAFSVDKYADFNANQIKDRIKEIFGDISKDDTLRLAAEQSMSSVFSSLGVPEDRANEIRASVLQAFGIGDKDSWLQGEVRTKMMSLIDETFPEIGAKIRASVPLTDAEKAKVKELMDDAKKGLINQYPELERTLQNMLASSKFQAVIDLVFRTDDKFNDVQSELTGRIPSFGNGILLQDTASKYRNYAKKWGKENSWYSARNSAKSDIDSAYNEYQSALKSGAKDVYSKEQAWTTVRDAAKTLLHYDYSGEGKKSNKPKKTPKGRQEDTLLKELQERLSSLKSARQMYQKYKPYMSDDEAKRKTYKLFPNVVGLDLDNYADAVDALIKNSKFKATTPERRKFLTSTDREKAEWKWDEVDKPAIEVQASERNAYMNRLSSQWDLYKTLLEKTGNKRYAESAWIDAFQMDDKSKSLMNLYYQNYGKHFNMQGALNMSDEEAKKTFKNPDEYNEWKKIVDLLRNNYVQSLQDGADAMQQTMSVAQKLDSITEKYAKKRKDAGANQDLIDRYDFLEKQEKSGVLFDQMKSEVNWDGVFGDLGNYTKKELKKVRKDINDLISGGLLNGMTTTDIKSIYDGLGKLNQTIDGEGFSGLSDLLKDLVDASAKYDEAVKDYNETVKKYGKDSWQAEQARKGMQQADQRRRGAQGTVNDKKLSNVNKVFQLADMFRTLGSSDGSGSTLLQNAGSWTTSIMQMFGSDKNGKNNSQMVGGIVGMFAGLTEAIAQKGFGGFLSDAFEDIGGAVNSIFKDVLGINLGISGADYSDYNDAKAEYDNLISVWDSLISKKTEYMNIHWGTEATEASKEAQAMLQAEIEQTKIIAQKRLNSGASAGSHSIWYRMWKGSYGYNGQNWKDVAPEISKKYGVQFNGMEDLLDMNSDVLSKIKTDYTGLWANMDSDYRDYLEKLIEYGEKADDMAESLTEKLTGNKFSSLVESWGDAMASMANSSDNLVDNFEDNLKKTIINSMIEDMYGEKIKKILAKAKKYGDKDESENWYVNGQYMGAYTPQENAEIKSDVEEVAKQIEATRDFFKKSYGWSDSSSSSSTNSVKGITEETADILVSYANAIRLDCSVMRAEQAKYFPEMSEIAKSQLTQLNQIAQHTLRNADAAERIEAVVTSFNDNFNRVINGTKVLHVK